MSQPLPSQDWLNLATLNPWPVRRFDDDNSSRLIVTIRRTADWGLTIDDLRNAAQFECRFEGMLEDRLAGLESAVRLLELEYRYAILRSAPGDEFGAANRIMGRHGGPGGSVVAVEIDSILRFTTPSIGLPFKLGGLHSQYLSMLNVPTAHANTTGKGIRVAIVDTGADLAGVRDFYDVLNISGSHPGLPSEDKDGHGTVMATLIQEVAPDAEIFVVRISDQGHATLLDAMAGVSVGVLDCHADILNLSLGFPSFGSVCPLCGSSPTARSIAFETHLRSLSGSYKPIYVASAGNDASNRSEFEYPGAYDFSVVVGSLNSLRDRSRFSQYRKAGGHRQYAMAPGGETDSSGSVKEDVGSGTQGSCYGTSVAAAYFSGMLALFRAEARYQSLRPDRFIDDVLTKRCVPHAHGTAIEYGFGAIQYS